MRFTYTLNPVSSHIFAFFLFLFSSLFALHDVCCVLIFFWHLHLYPLGSKMETVAAKGMTRKPVDIERAVRVVEELEAASMSVLMHGKTPMGADFRSWLTELVEGRGVGRGAGWQNEHSPFFSSQSLAKENDAATFRESQGADYVEEEDEEEDEEEEEEEEYEGMVEMQSAPVRADDEERAKDDRWQRVSQEPGRFSTAGDGVGPIAAAAAAAANRMFDESVTDVPTPPGTTDAAETQARQPLPFPDLDDDDDDDEGTRGRSDWWCLCLSSVNAAAAPRWWCGERPKSSGRTSAKWMRNPSPRVRDMSSLTRAHSRSTRRTLGALACALPLSRVGGAACGVWGVTRTCTSIIFYVVRVERVRSYVVRTSATRYEELAPSVRVPGTLQVLVLRRL